MIAELNVTNESPAEAAKRLVREREEMRATAMARIAAMRAGE